MFIFKRSLNRAGPAVQTLTNGIAFGDFLTNAVACRCPVIRTDDRTYAPVTFARRLVFRLRRETVVAASAPPRSGHRVIQETERPMARSLTPSEQAHTSWTLGRHGQRLTCTLITQPSGEYVLRLTHEGRRILDERCEGPEHALGRSLEAFGALVARKGHQQ